MFDSVSNTEVADNADLHGIIGRVSPMKKGLVCQAIFMS